MKHTLLTTLLLFLTVNLLWGQNPQFNIPGTIILSDSVPKNGAIDRIEDMALRAQVPFTMPDGVKLQTDVFLPIFQDSLTVDFDLLGNKVNLVVMKKGIQYIMYDSINGKPNPNPYQLPVIFTRTPYNKKGSAEASLFALLGYSAMFQDLRGRYASEGTFIPLYNDSWVKSPYFPDRNLLDITDQDSPHNANNFEDGYSSLEFIKNNLVRTFDRNYDGIPEKTDLVYNGAIGMFGPSALGYSQTQAAAARKIDPNKPGLKSILPIVATGDFHKSTVFPNGNFREMLVTGWLTGQMLDLEDQFMDIDNDLQNDIHTSVDYGLTNRLDVAERTIDSYSSNVYSDGKSVQMPNSIYRSAFDIDYAPVNEEGFSDPNGPFNRYSNMEVPSYYLSGWWDIFVDGTIETFNKQRKHVSPEMRDKIKLVMGPWAHQTITDRTTGDVTYPESVLDITKISLSDFGDDIELGQLIDSDLFAWYRYTLNNAKDNVVGDAKFILPRSNDWQKIIQGIWVKFPANDYKIRYSEMLNFMLGLDGLKGIPLLVRLGSINVPFVVDVPKLDEPILPGIATQKIDKLNTPDYTKVDPIRFYVVGPVEDGVPENATVGNYWMGADTFPLPQLTTYTSLFLHGNGKADFKQAPTAEVIRSYTHDPDNPVATLGGANMIGKTPILNKANQGQINMANPVYRPYVLDRPDVLQFETEVLEDTLSIIGFPKAVIHAAANPEGANAGDPTDVDFFVRIVDVYPDGRELFVVEGSVNARAREYARSIAEDQEDVNAPFTNIESGKTYEYYFNMLPIAYTFGKEHKVKIIISSGNYQRYQSNPCIPMNDGEFFRRKPGQNKTYVFQGKEMAARKSLQQVFFAPGKETRVILPVYGKSVVTSTKPVNIKPSLDITLFPNPVKDVLQAYISEPGQYNVQVLNVVGQEIRSLQSNEQIRMDISSLPAGVYMLNVSNRLDADKTQSVKFMKY